MDLSREVILNFRHPPDWFEEQIGMLVQEELLFIRGQFCRLNEVNLHLFRKI